MLLKSTSAGSIATNIASGLKTTKDDKNGLKKFLKSMSKDTKASDLAKGFSLAGFTKEETQAALKNSKFRNSLADVVEEFGNFNLATSGLKGKFNLIKDNILLIIKEMPKIAKQSKLLYRKNLKKLHRIQIQLNYLKIFRRILIITFVLLIKL